MPKGTEIDNSKKLGVVNGRKKGKEKEELFERGKGENVLIVVNIRSESETINSLYMTHFPSVKETIQTTYT